MTSANTGIEHGSAKHKRIKEAVLARYKLSEREMGQFTDQLEESEDEYQAYMKETEVDSIRKNQRKSDGIPHFTTLQVPYSYATLLTFHTYTTSVFLGRSPVFQYTARHGEPEMSVQAVEALMDYQAHVGRQLAPLYVWMHDAPKYGYGVLCSYWEEEEITTSEIVEVPREYYGFPLPGTSRKVRRTVTSPGYVGNKFFNVRPFDFIWDPRVPITALQEGEFSGRKLNCGWNKIADGEAQGKYTNISALRDRVKRGSSGTDELRGSERLTLPQDSGEALSPIDLNDVGYVQLTELYVRLIPNDWELGSSKRPEMWRFTLAAGEVVIEARPCSNLHGKFPFFVLPNEIDAYSLIPRSMPTILKPLNDTLTWLFNSHFFNVRASLNNQFLVDPSRVVMKDVQADTAGGIIRLKESAYGSDIRTVLSQLPVNDVTQGHVRDAQMVIDLIQRVSGVTDNIMGMVNASGRKTATEVRSSNAFGTNRLKTISEYWSAGDFGLLAQTCLQNTQQYYELERMFKIAGDLSGLESDPYRKVSPEDIQGFFDFVPVDGTLPVDRFAQANLWREILMGLQKMPEVGQQYNLGGIFAWMAQLAGLKNIKQFKIQTQPNEVINDERQKGNLVPVASAVGRDLGRVSEPGQVSGLGATG